MHHPHHTHHHRGPMSGRRHGHGGWGAPGGRRRRMRRGDVRAALLVLLDEQPMTGYAMIEEIERRSEDAWRPSPGSVYPTLQQLEDEGLIRPQEGEGRQPFTLTDEGKAHVAEHREQLGEPWATPAAGIGKGRRELRGLFGEIAAAAYQVAAAGDDAQVERAKQLLAETRRGLYRILAEDDPAEGGEA